MKLHLANSAGIKLITGHGEGFVEINHKRRARSLILLPDVELEWDIVTFEQLAPEHLASLTAHRPNLVILGTGRQHRFPHPRLYRDLIEAGIGLEHMHTGAACRTYNILATEGRVVAAALIID